MEIRSRGGKLNMSFSTLSNLSSDGDLDDALLISTSRNAVSDSESDALKRGNRGWRRRRKKGKDGSSMIGGPIVEEECGFVGVEGLRELRCENGVDGLNEYCLQSALSDEVLMPEGCGGRSAVVEEVAEVWSSGKLRQRNWSGSGGGMEEEAAALVPSSDISYENGKEAEAKEIEFISSSFNKMLELKENGVGL